MNATKPAKIIGTTGAWNAIRVQVDGERPVTLTLDECIQYGPAAVESVRAVLATGHHIRTLAEPVDFPIDAEHLRRYSLASLIREREDLRGELAHGLDMRRTDSTSAYTEARMGALRARLRGVEAQIIATMRRLPKP